MYDLSKKLLIGDYYQLFSYPIRKQIIYLFRKKEFTIIEGLINGLILKKNITSGLDGIEVITIFDEAYPKLLLETFDPPLVLYCKGDISLLHSKNKVAIVGSRQPQKASLEAVKKVITDFKIKGDKEKLVIVSGLAKGIDGESHRLALSYGLKTIAVLGFGFDYIYPIENKGLYHKIVKYGLVISEYPPTIGINKWQFIARNRIISGLCKVVIVIEAKEKSGSLITAELALSENREVYIVGGNSFDKAYYGSNVLVQDGAKLLLDVEEVISEYRAYN